MQTCCLGAESWTVCCLCGTPVPQRGLGSLPMSQPVCDGEAGVSLQLRQNHQHLPEREQMQVSFSPGRRHPHLTGGSADLCRGGTLSTALRLPRVDTTLKLSLQSHDTWRWCLGCLFSTITMSPAQPWVR